MLDDDPICLATLKQIVNTDVQPLSNADGHCSKNISTCKTWTFLGKGYKRGTATVSRCKAIVAAITYLSVGSTWTYLELPATNVTTARSMAAAGMAKPMVQLTLSWMYTKVVTAKNDPRLMAK